MIQIKELLTTFDEILISNDLKINTIRNVFFEVIGVKIKKEDIQIKNNIIYLNIKPLYKNEILLKKEEIVNKLKKVFIGRTPKEIR